MIVRDIEEKDLDKILRMEKENFPDPWPKDSFIYDMNNEVADVKVLESEEEIIGYYVVYYMFENADIGNICIDLKYQGKGYGEFLLKDLIKNCIKKEVEFLHLEVRIDNYKAYNLYEKMGFQQIAEVPDAYRLKDGTSRKSILMIKTL